MAWTKHGSRIVYENDWMTVREDRVSNPGGGKNLYGHVQFKNIAVAILPVDEEGNTRLVGQSRYTLNAYSWELPMGGSALHENPLKAAQRELQEETGLSAGHWAELMRLHTSNSITDELGIIFVARDLTEGLANLEETEDITVRTIAVNQAIQMVKDGDITDALTVAALLRFNFDYGTESL